MKKQVERWRPIIPVPKRLVMWGAADQCRVNRPILASMGCEIAALVDDTPNRESPFPDLPLLYGWEGMISWLSEHNPAEIGFVIAIGNPYGHIRCRLHDKLSAVGLRAISFADPTALICCSATVYEGLQAMPMAIIHNDAIVHRQCIVNTRALVEHDCVLEEGVEIGPGAVLCGRVYVGANTWIGAGATIRPRVRIGRDAIIGAGAVVVSDIPDGVVAVGVPAQPVPGSNTASAQARLKQRNEMDAF